MGLRGWAGTESPPDELCVVVGFARQELHLPPVQELVEAGERVLADGALVDVGPHFHTHQHDPDVQWPVKLSERGTSGNPIPSVSLRSDL